MEGWTSLKNTLMVQMKGKRETSTCEMAEQFYKNILKWNFWKKNYSRPWQLHFETPLNDDDYVLSYADFFFRNLFRYKFSLTYIRWL
jgi:hypothetical protein